MGTQGLGIALLDLVTHAIQGGHGIIILQALHAIHLLHGLRGGFLHLRLIHLLLQLLDLLLLLLEAHVCLLLLCFCLLGALNRAGVHLLGIFQLFFHRDQLGGEHFSGLVELLSLGRIPRCVSLIRLLDSHPSIIGELLHVLLQTVHLHLQLIAVTNHGSRLLGEFRVLAARSLSSLLDLHLRVSVILDLGIEGLHQVLPAFGQGISHDYSER